VTRRIIAGIGFFAAALVVVLIFIVGILFIAPGTNFFGATAVTGRQTFTTYLASEIPGVRDLLFSRNIMIESNYIPIEVNVSKSRQLDELSIQVWENSTGLSFNSIQRTHVEWTQVLVQRDGNPRREMFYKVKVVEPSGMVNRRDDVIVINLPSTDAAEATRSGYNFILNTGRSSVTFTADDGAPVQAYPLNIGTLEIMNASGTVTVPANHSDITNVVVDSRAAKLSCRSPISSDVLIMCDVGDFTFGDIGGYVAVEGKTNSAGGVNQVVVAGQSGVGGNVTLRGASVIFEQTHRDGAVGGDIYFRAERGLLSVARSGHIFMRTTSANLTGISATPTSTSDRMIRSIDFVSIGDSTVNVAQVGNVTSNLGNDKLAVKNVRGSITLRRVWVDTDVESEEGAITVAFDAAIVPGTSGMPRIKIRAYDGAVTATNIVGETDIFVRVNGRATVNAHFRQVRNGRIEYEGSTRRNRNIGNIDVRLYRNIPYCIVEIVNTRGAHNRTNPSMLTTMQHAAVANGAQLVNGASYHVRYASRIEDQASTGNLRIDTSNTFNLHTSSS